MEIVRKIISHVVRHADEIVAATKRPYASRLTRVVDFQGSGKVVYRIHEQDMFPAVLRATITEQDIIDAVAQLTHVTYDPSSLWFTIEVC